uniref:Uncharacterized protein n=1 Tax=Arundo donax TaxID=35708 RepID=A0A0A8ZA69_ARUDO
MRLFMSSCVRKRICCQVIVSLPLNFFGPNDVEILVNS